MKNFIDIELSNVAKLMKLTFLEHKENTFEFSVNFPDQVKNIYGGVILESPFTSMIDAAKNVYPYFPINLLLKDRYENTRLGRQELYAEILEDIEGSLFKRDLIDNARVKQQPQLSKIVIAVDPAVTSNVNSDETGIIVVGRGEDNHYYILDDRSGTYTPDDWIKKAIGLYYEYEANYITAEVNNGGDLIERLLRVQDGQIPYRAIRSSKGKMLRWDLIVTL